MSFLVNLSMGGVRRWGTRGVFKLKSVLKRLSEKLATPLCQKPVESFLARFDCAAGMGRPARKGMMHSELSTH